MAKGVWRKRLGWTAAIVALLGLALVLSFRGWAPAAIRLALRTRGIRVQSITRPKRNVWQFEGVEVHRSGNLFRAGRITTLGPREWKRRLAENSTNDPAPYFTVDRWRFIQAPSTNGRAQSVFERLSQFQSAAEKLRAKCPQAVFLNGVFERAGKEFRFATVQWKNGELSGDLTWPTLNDPADFKLKLIDPAKTQFILKQYSLDIASKITAEQTNEMARIAGYTRWKNNRADFDLLFGPEDSAPQSGFIKSDGLKIPGDLLKIPAIQELNARFRLVITNGQFDLRLGVPTSTSAQEGG